MSPLRLYLLGPPQIELNGGRLTINRRKVLALLAYLATSQRAHQRDHLAALLWPGYDQSSARANLRKCISLLGQQLDKEWLDIQREQISLIRGDGFWLDIDQFRRLIDGCISQRQSSAGVTPSCLDSLNQAVDLYRDDFLSGFSLPDAPEFTDWQLFQAENYRRRLAQAYEILSQGHAEQNEWKSAITFARSWLYLDDLDESAHRQLMRLLALKGQRNAALVQYEECREILAEELEVEPTVETTALFEEIRQGAFSQEVESTSTRSPPPSAPRINLPPQLTTFVGRQDDVARITRLLCEEPACRHLTLFGAGGAGKTRLAIKAAGAAGEAFSHGVTFVSLVSLSHPDSLILAIADALGLDLSTGTPRDHLLNYLRRKELLLILDNFEHLISQQAADFLSDILLAAPGVKLLVTSRQRLNLEQEWSLEVSGMSLPPSEEQESAPLEEYEAVQLFLQRARRVQPNFALSNENRFHVVRICRLVGGLPLGIELAAAWLRLISCQEIASEIERSLDFLTSPYPDIPERHHSLQAVFEHSWQLLTEEEKQLLRRLSVFRGGFTGRASQRVAGASLPLLVSLVDKALLRRTRSRRYQMHELLKQFAAGKLAEAPLDKERTQEQYAHYYLTFVQQRFDEWVEPKKRALDAFVADIDNVWAAWYHALSRRDDELLAKSADSLHVLAFGTGRLLEGAKAFQAAVEEIPEAEAPLLLGRLLREHGHFCTFLGDMAQGTELLQQSVSLLRRVNVGSQRDLAHSLYQLAQNYWNRGLWMETDKYAQESLELLTRSQDRRLMGLSIEIRGWVAVYQGQYQKGIKLLEKSVKLLEDSHLGIGRVRGATFSKLFLGIIARLQGDYAKAERIFENVLESLRVAGQVVEMAYSLRELGYLNISLGNYSLAKSQMEEGLELFRESGAGAPSLFLLTGLGYVARLSGEHGQAEQLHQEGLAIARESGERRGLAVCLDNLARLAYDQAEYKKAGELFRESLKLHEQLGHPHGQATVLCQLGITALSLGTKRHGEAEQRLHQALKISTEIGATPLILEVLRGFALLRTADVTSRASQVKTLELLSLILNHPASEQETKDRASQLWDKLAAELPDDVVASAKIRGPNADIETIIKQIVV